MVTGFERACLYLCSASQHFVLDLEDVKGSPAQNQRMEEVNISPGAVFVDHDYSHHAAIECRARISFAYKIYLIPEYVRLKYGVALPMAVDVV